MNLKQLKEECLKHVVCPMTFREIEQKVGKQPTFALGIAIHQLVLAGKLYSATPPKYTSEWPVYSNQPIPKKFTFPKRDASAFSLVN